MPASNISELFDLWTHSARQYDSTAPFDSCRSLYATIDAIRDGDAPWQCLTVSSVSDNLSERAPSWQKQEYEVWYRDPDVVITNLLDNPDFASQFDVSPNMMIDSHGERRWADFMSGNFAWRRSVSVWFALSPQPPKFKLLGHDLRG